MLDFSDEGRSIFNREKPLSEKTLERIFAGLVKFVAGGKDKFMVKYNSMSQSGKYQPPSVDDPCPVVATQNRLAIAQVSFLSKQFGGHPDSKNLSTDSPAGTLTANPKHKLVTVKRPDAQCQIAVSPDDSPMTKKIKGFMVQYSIADIKMRMLKIGELKLIMGFPENYILVGNQTEQKKFIGNAVEVNMARVLCESLYKSLTPMCATKEAI